MDGNAFSPAGRTYVLTASDTFNTPTELKSDVDDVNQYRIYNSGVMTVFVTILPTPGEVIESQGIPDEDTPYYAIPITAGAVEIFSGPDDAYISAYTEAGDAKLYVTPGRGM